MTTIAVSEGKMATDSQATRGFMAMPGNFKKIYEPEEGKEYWEVNGTKVIAFGLCGNAHAADFIKEYLAKGITFRSRVEHDDELDFEAVIVTEKHEIFAWNVYANKEKRGEDQFLLCVNLPYASGSGHRFALAAMVVGKDAVGAVKLACKLDVMSGGDVVVFNFPPVPAVPSVRPEHLKPKVESEEKIEGEGKRGKGKEPSDKAA